MIQKILLMMGAALSLGIAEVKELKYEVLEEITRSKKGFTQGFFILEGKLYESTGGYGSSLIRRFDLKTQEVEVSKALPPDIFAEGLTPYGENEMIQLTWKKGLGIIYDREQVNIIKTFRYKTEGWGITSKGREIVMSDGSSTLYFLDPESLEVSQQRKVTANGAEVKQINELEWVGDFIYANVWLSDDILKINPETGKVVGKFNMKNLFPGRPKNQEAVLNGIAYDKEEDVFYLTGKTWGKMFKVKFLSE